MANIEQNIFLSKLGTISISKIMTKVNIVSRHLYTVIKQSGPVIHRSRIIFYDFVLNILFPTIRIRSAVPCRINLISVVCR